MIRTSLLLALLLGVCLSIKCYNGAVIDGQGVTTGIDCSNAINSCSTTKVDSATTAYACGGCIKLAVGIISGAKCDECSSNLCNSVGNTLQKPDTVQKPAFRTLPTWKPAFRTRPSGRDSLTDSPWNVN